jgi:hypothetical protein
MEDNQRELGPIDVVVIGYRLERRRLATLSPCFSTSSTGGSSACSTCDL